MIHGALEHEDYIEGIRALIIDKDQNPRWHPARLAEVSPSAVDAFFAPRWRPDLHPLESLP